jgi:hypothetical protein
VSPSRSVTRPLGPGEGELEALGPTRRKVFKRIFGSEARKPLLIALGKLGAKCDTLFRLLARAGMTLSDDDRARIHACADTGVLDRWIDNIFGAKTAIDVLRSAGCAAHVCNMSRALLGGDMSATHGA